MLPHNLQAWFLFVINLVLACDLPLAVYDLPGLGL